MSPASSQSLRSFVVVLEYCGGAATDQLVEQLQVWNPGRTIHVLDNASPTSVSRYATHRNTVNSRVGGGILDCMKLAESGGYRLLTFIANDLHPLTRFSFDRFEQVFEDESVVQVSASITSDSRQAEAFPWMVRQNGGGMRRVPHADILATTLDVDFIRTFGGFPPSDGGWGYSWELAYSAASRGRSIVVCDFATVAHADPAATLNAWNVGKHKWLEHLSVYRQKYGSIPWQGYRNRVVTGPWCVRSYTPPPNGLVLTGRRGNGRDSGELEY